MNGSGKAVEGLGALLSDVEARALHLPWARQRRWRVATHVGMEASTVVVDLHDLSVKLALAVVDVLLECEVPGGAVVLVTGRGRHTGGHSKLRAAVLGKLRSRGLRVVPRGAGRLWVALDADAVPRSAPEPLLWLLWAMLLLAVAIATGVL